MANPTKTGTRRFVRATGPFTAQHLGTRNSTVCIYNLNLGGGLVIFDEQPASDTFILTIDLPDEGAITATAEALYRDSDSVAVRFVALDADASERLSRAIERSTGQQSSTS